MARTIIAGSLGLRIRDAAAYPQTKTLEAANAAGLTITPSISTFTSIQDSLSSTMSSALSSENSQATQVSSFLIQVLIITTLNSNNVYFMPC